MSFTDDYDKLRKKRKQEEEQEKKQSKGNSFTEEYDRLKANRQTEEDGDIAPVVTSYEEYDNSPILQAMYRFRGGREGWMQDEIFRAKREANPDEWYKEDDGLEIFKSGAFSDGYDFGDVTMSILGTAGDAALEAAKGFGKVGEGLGKGIALGAAQVGDWFGADDWAEGVRDRAQTNFIDDWTEGIDKGIEKYSFLGSTTDAILQGVGQVGAVAATGGAGGAGVGTATLFGSSFGNSTSEALQNGASDEEAYTYGLMSASVETISEMIFGGLGKGVNMLGFSKGLSSIDDMAAKAAGKFFKSDTGKNVVQWAVKSGFEGAEEVIAGLGNAAAKKLTYMSEKDLAELVQDENLFEQFFVGAMTSGVMQSGIIPGTSNGSLIESNKTGRDFISGLSKNEQSVVDKVFKDELAKAEENGKVTNKQKNEIYNDVIERMEKGRIDTDTIEEVLGDKSAYDTLENEAKEYDTLYNTADINLSQAQRDRRAELIEKNKANPYETALKTAKEQYSENVRSKVQGDRLLESYREKDRLYQDFQADFSKFKGAKYEDAAKKTIENAIKAGANNTNAVHDIVDFAAKIAGDTGKAYDFQSDEQSKADFIERQTKLIEELEKQANRNDAQNKKLTELKDILEKVKSGEVKVNGNISANGIVLNLGAGKPLNRVVGHEVTHTFEPAKGSKESKEYTALKDALYKLAKAKKIDVDQKRAEYELLYEGLDADAEAEMIADMVGDFLFDDTDFAYNLATENRNVFQKIWDEVKHLYKIATAGSKEARELARVQKAFEDAYRAIGKENSTESGAKFNLERTQDMSWSEQINGALYDGKNIRRSDTLVVGQARDTAVASDIEDKPLAIPQSVLTKASSGKDISHSIKRGKLAKLDDGIKNAPITIFNPDRNAVVYVTNIKQGGLPIVAAFDLNAEFDGDSVHKATSIHLQVDTMAMLKNLPESAKVYIQKNELDPVGATNNLRGLAAKIEFIDGTLSQKDSDVKMQFSLSKSVEETKDLVALHNLTADKLSKSLELGGFPMPSIAITKADIPHSNFGEITLIFGRDTIDPKVNKKNKAYSADAWTPVFPRVEYEADSKVANSVSQKLRDLGGKVDDYFQRDLNRVSYDFDDLLNRNGGEEGLIQRVMDNDGLKAAYLEDIGKHIEAVTTQQEAEKNFNPNSADKYQKIMDILGVTTAEEIDKVNLKDAIDNYGAELEAVYPGMTKTVLRMGKLLGTVKSYIENKDSAPAYITVVDHDATRKAVDDALDTEGYEAWIRNLFSGIVKDSGIYNNKDIFTPSGNRRSFKQTHLPFTLENIVKAMASQNDGKSKNVSGFNGVKTLRAATAETFKSVDEMHQRKGRLQNRTQEEADALNDALQTRLFKVMEAIDNESGQIGGSNPYIRLDSIGEVLTEIGESGKYGVADIQRVFKEYSRNISDDTAMEVKQLLYDVAQMPVNIFESKPQRVVSFDEAKVFVIPRNADVKLKQELLNRGYNIAEYDPDVEGDRQKVVNQFEEYKFSLSDVSEGFTPIRASEFFGKDFKVQKPAQEDIAPIIEKPAKVEPEAEAVAPVAEQYEAIRPKREPQPKLVKADKASESDRVANVLTEEQQAEKKKSNAWSMVKNNVLDKGMVFEDLSLATGNRELQARWNSIRYSEGKAQKLIGEGNAAVKSLSSIRETVEGSGKTKQFYEYLYHMHNIDRMTLEDRFKDVPNKAVFGDAVTADVSREAVAKLEQAYPAFKKWAQDVYDYNSYLRELLVDGGVISSETAELWEEMYPHYVPIRRAGDTGLNINVPLDTGRTGVNAPIKRATGGNSDILPLFDTMGQRTIQSYKAIAKNRFGVELKNTLGTTIANEATDVDEAIDSIDTQDGLLQEGKNGKSPTFTVFENGEKVTFEITDEMYDAMKPKGKGMAYTNKVANTISNIRRGTLTEYNPWFMLKNAVKDVQDILINSQHAARTYASIPEAIKQMSTKGHWYQEYLNNGGDQNTYFDNETATFKKDGALEAAKKYTGLNAISKANNVIEMMPRLAEYIASRKAGRSVDVSMLDAARVTTNFAAGGDLTKMLNRNGFTFLNASVQGAVQQARNIREAKANGLKGWANLATKYLVAGLPALLLNGLIWEDDEEYEELSDYVKENYYIVGKYGDGQFVRIPKGRTVAVIQNAFEQMKNAVTGDAEVDLGRFLELVVSNLAPNNPIDNNILSPIVQVANNETWYGEDLVPTRLQDLPAAEQYDESTDALSRWLGETFDISPYKVNYLLDQYSGVIGDTFLPMMTPEAESGDNSFLGNMIAPLKDMFTADSVMNNQNVSDFYDTKDELTVNANASGASDEDVLMSKYMNAVNAELAELYKQKREIQNSDMTDSRKYAKVRDIQQQIIELTKDGLNTYEDVSFEDDYREGGEYARIGDMVFKKDDDGEWGKLSDEQLTKYEVTKAAGDASYATDGENHYRWYVPGEDSEAEPGWKKITEDQLEKQEEVTKGLGISPEEYWNDKDEYDYAYKNPGNYAVAKAVGGYDSFKTYSSELYDIKADKDSYGKSISGSRKEKVIDYINGLDADYGEKIILFKSEYKADDSYNYDIIEYLNGREDISYEEMETILKELGFKVDSKGNVTWD